MQLTNNHMLKVGIAAILAIYCLSLAAISAPISSTSPSNPQDSYLVLKNNANVRTLPSLSGKVLSVLPQGTKVVMQARSGEWLYILSPDGLRGWINQLTVDSTPSITPIQESYWLNSASELLAEPQAEAPVVTKIFPMQKIILLNSHNSWQQVQTSSYIGWINSPLTSSQPINEEFLYGTVYVNKTGNVRQYPHQEAPILGKIYSGDSLMVIGSWNEWYHVFWNQQSGYVHSLLLIPDSLNPIPYQYIKVLKDGNLRKRPDLNAPVIAQLKAEQTGYRLKQQASWNLAYFPYSSVGWVHDLLIEVTDQPPLQHQSRLAQQINDLLKQALQARQKKAYSEAIKSYRTAQELLRQLDRMSEIPDCLVHQQCIIQYVFSDRLYYPFSQANNPLIGKLQNISPSAPCYNAVQQTLKEWQQGFEFRTNLLNIFSQKNYPIENLIKTLNQNPAILPLPLEAEARRLIGRYFVQSNQKDLALSHQKESVLLYRLLKEQNLLTSNAQLGNYFEVLCELAQNYLDLGHLHPSMAVLDDVYRLIQQNNREDWNQRYLKLVEQVTAAGPR